MPKPLQLKISVEEIAFGRVFRTLNSMEGVATIDILTEDKPNGSKPSGRGGIAGQKKGGSQTIQCVILGELIRDQVHDRSYLVECIAKAGRSRSSFPDSVAKMVKAGEIKRVGSGADATFSITAKGKKRYETACAIQAPEGEE